MITRLYIRIFILLLIILCIPVFQCTVSLRRNILILIEPYQNHPFARKTSIGWTQAPCETVQCDRASSWVAGSFGFSFCSKPRRRKLWVTRFMSWYLAPAISQTQASFWVIKTTCNECFTWQNQLVPAGQRNLVFRSLQEMTIATPLAQSPACDCFVQESLLHIDMCA